MDVMLAMVPVLRPRENSLCRSRTHLKKKSRKYKSLSTMMTFPLEARGTNVVLEIKATIGAVCVEIMVIKVVLEGTIAEVRIGWYTLTILCLIVVAVLSVNSLGP